MDVPRNLKGGNRSFFDLNVNLMGQWPFCQSRLEASYFTSGFGAIIQRNLHTYRCPVFYDLNACVIEVHARKA